MADSKELPSSLNLTNTAISSILEVTSSFVCEGGGLDVLLGKILKNVCETFGLKVATIGIMDRETGLISVRAAYGYGKEAEERILKVKYSMERMNHDLTPDLKVGRNTYYVPAEKWEPEGDDWFFFLHPERVDRARRFPDEWHELDFIDFLMYENDGSLLGYLEIEHPDDDKVPSDEKLRAIEVFSDLAAIAIQNARLCQELEDDRKKIELLLDLIGHDINNYSQAVSGFIELAMSRKGVPEPSRKSLGKALEQLWNLSKLVTNVKVYGMAESAGEKNLHPMDVVEVVREAVGAATNSAHNRDVNIVVKDDGRPKFAVMNSLAKDVFLNLLTNAVKFDEHEKVDIEVSTSEIHEDDRDLWVVSVADHGPGVPDELKTAIFQRFAKGSNAPRSSSGLGLHIARMLTTAYKGRIWVEDRVVGDGPKGSVFKVALPKAQK